MFRIPHGNQTPITARSPTIAAILKVVRANFPGIRKLSQCKLMSHFYCTIHNHITIAASINVLAYDKIVRFMSFSTTPSPPTPTDIARHPPSKISFFSIYYRIFGNRCSMQPYQPTQWTEFNLLSGKLVGVSHCVRFAISNNNKYQGTSAWWRIGRIRNHSHSYYTYIHIITLCWTNSSHLFAWSDGTINNKG